MTLRTPDMKKQDGVALTVVAIVIVLLTLVTAFAANMGYNQKRMLDAFSGRRIKIYYRAMAGVVDASWRIRTNYTTGLAPAGSFTTAAYNPNSYALDVDNDGTMDTDVDIGAADAQGARPINSTGRDI